MRFLGLTLEECPGVQLYRPSVAGDFQSPRTTVHIVLPKVEKLLGFPLSKEKAFDMLGRLGEVIEGPESGFDLIVSSYRQDIQRPCDVAEEIARFVGYGSFLQTMPKPVYSVAMEAALAELPVVVDIKAYLRAYGFCEVVTYPFSSRNMIEALEGFDPFGMGSSLMLENPLQATDPYLRNTLALSLMKVLRTHTGAAKDVVRCFEVARIFGRSKEGKPSERETLGILLKGGLARTVWERAVLLSPLQALQGFPENVLIFLYLSRSIVRPESGLFWEANKGFRIEEVVSGSPVAVFGEVSQNALRAFDVKTKGVYFLEVLFPQVQKARTATYRPFGRFPAVLRDISFVAPEQLAYQELEDAIERCRPELLAAYELFDVYQGGAIPPGFKVYNVRCTYQSTERTLTDEEVNGVHFGFIEQLTQKLPIKLRT
jgi:phenylalanyl-tRNA synthetase beta chain